MPVLFAYEGFHCRCGRFIKTNADERRGENFRSLIKFFGTFNESETAEEIALCDLSFQATSEF